MLRMLCYVTLCYVMLCYFMLCCVVLCCVRIGVMAKLLWLKGLLALGHATDLAILA